MTIRIKTLILILAAVVLFVGSSFLVTNYLLNNRIRTIESASITKDIERVQLNLDSELARINSITEIWGPRDSTYQFFQDPDSDWNTFGPSNFSSESLTSLGINYLVFVNLQGEIVWTTGVDVNTGSELLLPEDVRNLITQTTTLTSFPRTVASRFGVIYLPSSGHLIFSASQILRSNRTGPRLGTVIAIRFLDADVLSKLNRLSQTTIAFTSAPGNENLALFEEKAPGEFVKVAERTRANSISTTIAFNDYTGTRRVYLSMSSPRDINSSIGSLISVFLTVFVFLGIGLGLVLWIGQERLAIMPIDRLRSRVDKIGAEKKFNERLPAKARDEVGRLSRSMNLVLEGLEQSQMQVQGRMAQLQTVAEISRAATSVLESQTLLQRVADLVQSQFKLYYVGVFLVDEAGEFAVLNAGTGDPGRKMLDANHRLQVGGTSMIGWATSNRKARIALDVGKEAVRFENPLLPLTHSELAIPIISRAKVIGAISLQSQEVNAFTEEDIFLFQGIADALAVALENASLFQQTQKNLEDIRRLNRAYIQTSWVERLERTRDLSFSYTNPEADVKSGSSEQFQFPITLRDQILGNISLDVAPASLSDVERNLIESIADQVALALENARLLETTQSRAAFERKLNTMATEFSQKTRVEEILRSISKELSSLPTVNSVSVHLNPVVQGENIQQPKPKEKGEKDDDAIQY